MKKQYLVLASLVLLVVAFFVARQLYKGQQAEKTEKMAQSGDSPLNRSYAQTLGPDDAKVVIVEFFDPACETCRVFARPVKGLLQAYPGKVQLALRYAPFHAGSDKVVQMLEAARLQGKYWEALDIMFDSQPHWASHHNPQPELLWQYLPAAGIDMEQLRRDMNDPKVVEIVQQDIADAQALGVRKTPEFFVNGKPLPRFGFDQLEALVASEVGAQYGR